MGKLWQVNCRKCGEGAGKKLSMTDASKWGTEHAQDTHGDPRLGMKFSEPARDEDD